MPIIIPVPRRKVLEHALRAFEKFLSETAPSQSHKEDWKPWKVRSSNNIRKASEECNSCVYIYSDSCEPDNPDENSRLRNDRFTVIRYIGQTTASLERRSTTKRSRGEEYTWFDYIEIKGPFDFLLPSLELFLLSKFHTTNNGQHSRRIPSLLPYSEICIFDENAEVTDQSKKDGEKFLKWLDR